jgi:hypothetical protein
MKMSGDNGSDTWMISNSAMARIEPLLHVAPVHTSRRWVFSLNYAGVDAKIEHEDHQKQNCAECDHPRALGYPACHVSGLARSCVHNLPSP